MSQQEKKVLWFGDLVQPSGFGRIGNQVTKRLHMRGWQNMIGVSIPWPGYPFNPLPYNVWGLGGTDIWNRLWQIIAQEKPDVVVVCQDFPYAQTAFHAAPIDWSQTKFIIVTPIDGTPVHPEWLSMIDLADETMVISKFGVESLRMEGKQVDLLHPGVDISEFKPAVDTNEIKELRQKVGIAEDAFVIGSFMMNQGRKMVGATLAMFKEFAIDKPEAVLYMDMDKTSPAGFDMPTLIKQMGMDDYTILYRENAFQSGIFGLRERYILCDVTSQLAHREGFGLPNLESMACKIPPMMIDWCSGTELSAEGRAVRIRRIDYMQHGTWGGARDAFPDMKDWVKKVNALYKNPGKRKGFAEKGYEWAIQQTWDVATDQFEAILSRALEAQTKERQDSEPSGYYNPAPGFSDNGAGEHHHSSVQQPAGSPKDFGDVSVHNKPGNDGDTSTG